jgi:lipoprotein-anchoring transpeptidase ErfK/SrfK
VRRSLVGLVVACAVLAGCGGNDQVTYDSRDDLSGTAVATTTTTTVPDPEYRSYIATAPDATTPVTLYDEVGGPPSARVVPNPNENGVISTFLVAQRNVTDDAGDRWLEVNLPIRPNGSTAWVKEADVVISFTDLQVVVARGEHRLRVLKEGAPILDFPVGIGTTETPTPGGVFYIKELLQPTNPGGAYGPYAFGLSGYSNVISDSDQFGDGVIGIHGTNEPELVGTDVSHGCIRLRNEDITQLVGLLPLGTPVEITA